MCPIPSHLQQYTCTADDPRKGWTLNQVALGKPQSSLEFAVYSERRLVQFPIPKS